MRYAIVVCTEESARTGHDGTVVTAFEAFEDQMRANGMLVSRTRLRPTSTATTVRVRNGDLVIADGPFAETKEQVAGFYVLECRDLDEAIEVAAMVPAAHVGTIEVRPLWED